MTNHNRITRHPAFGPVVLVALVLLGLSASVDKAEAAEYAVVINDANAVEGSSDEMKELVGRLYLKEQSTWPGGPDARPLARGANSEAQRAFYEQVLGMNEAAVNDHWLRIKQTDGETPPRDVSSGRILFRLIGKYDGAFSIVKIDEVAQAPDTVRILFEFGD